jgi:hypothetical protein
MNIKELHTQEKPVSAIPILKANWAMQLPYKFCKVKN